MLKISWTRSSGVSSTILISSWMTFDSLVMSAERSRGFFTRSARISNALGRCSSTTLMEKQVNSFDVKASKCPPIASADRAISSPVRFVVPLKTMCSRKWTIPFCSSRSCREPVRSQIPMETDRTAGMDSVTTCSPFERVLFLTFNLMVFILEFRRASGLLMLKMFWPNLNLTTCRQKTRLVGLCARSLFHWMHWPGNWLLDNSLRLQNHLPLARKWALCLY